MVAFSRLTYSRKIYALLNVFYVRVTVEFAYLLDAKFVVAERTPYGYIKIIECNTDSF